MIKLKMNEMLQVLSKNSDLLTEYDLNFVKSVSNYIISKNETGKQYYKVRDIIFKLYCEKSKYKFDDWIDRNKNCEINFEKNNFDNDQDIKEISDLLD